jgi:hypothetical protein
VSNCQKLLVPLFPRDIIVTFIRWQQIGRGDHLHARYILTDMGGVHFDSGLDEGDPGETTDVRLLSERVYLQRWNDYQRSAATTKGLSASEKSLFRPTFQLVDRIQVKGRRTALVL